MFDDVVSDSRNRHEVNAGARGVTERGNRSQLAPFKNPVPV
jgi:hypothetical protein